MNPLLNSRRSCIVVSWLIPIDSAPEIPAEWIGQFVYGTQSDYGGQFVFPDIYHCFGMAWPTFGSMLLLTDDNRALQPRSCCFFLTITATKETFDPRSGGYVRSSSCMPRATRRG